MAGRSPIKPFGSCTLVIEWDAEHVAMFEHATITNKAVLQGVTISRLAKTPAGRTPWGGVWISVSMPEPMFSEILRDYLENNGTLDMAHCVQTHLYHLIPDEIIEAHESIPD